MKSKLSSYHLPEYSHTAGTYAHAVYPHKQAHLRVQEEISAL